MVARRLHHILYIVPSTQTFLFVSLNPKYLRLPIPPTLRSQPEVVVIVVVLLKDHLLQATITKHEILDESSLSGEVPIRKHRD
jgi:hypothetical protein